MYIFDVCESCHICAYMSHVWHEANLIYAMAHSFLPWLLYICVRDVPLSYMWHGWYIHICDMTHTCTYMTWLIYAYVWHDSHMHTCDMTHICIRVTWLTYAHVWHDSYMHTCDMTHICTHVTWLICVTWLIRRCDTSLAYNLTPLSKYTHIWHMGHVTIYGTWVTWPYMAHGSRDHIWHMGHVTI